MRQSLIKVNFRFLICHIIFKIKIIGRGIEVDTSRFHRKVKIVFKGPVYLAVVSGKKPSFVIDFCPSPKDQVFVIGQPIFATGSVLNDSLHLFEIGF